MQQLSPTSDVLLIDQHATISEVAKNLMFLSFLFIHAVIAKAGPQIGITIGGLKALRRSLPVNPGVIGCSIVTCKTIDLTKTKKKHIVKCHLKYFRDGFLYNRLLPVLICGVNREVVQSDTEGERRFGVGYAILVSYMDVGDFQLHVLYYLRHQFLDERLVQFVFVCQNNGRMHEQTIKIVIYL